MRKIFTFLWKIFKHILLLPLYCSMPDKYSVVTYNEWLEKERKEEQEPPN